MIDDQELAPAAPNESPGGSEKGPETGDLEAIERLKDGYQRIRGEMEKIIVGQDEVLEQVLIGIFARGHCLLVGVPGLAKTLMISTLADSLSLGFSRIQFTPDLMPSDITGTEVIQEDRSTGDRTFRFLQGPVFANVILADEINRTPPKTQAALLEAMQERQVTAGGTKPLLDEPCLLVAGTHTWARPEPPRWTLPLWGAGIGLAASTIALVRSSRRASRLLGAGLIGAVGLLFGLLGTVNPLLWLFSTLDAYGPNENWWLSSPLTLGLIPMAIALARQRTPRWLLPLAATLAALATLGLLWELTPLNQQDNGGFVGLLWPLLVGLAWLARSRTSSR